MFHGHMRFNPESETIEVAVGPVGKSRKQEYRLYSGEVEDEEAQLIASGYEWMCPQCDAHNTFYEIPEYVQCRECGKAFATSDDVEHAYH